MKKILRSLFSRLVKARLLIVLLIFGAGAYGYFGNDTEFVPEIRTATISQGDIIEAVGATGTLEAVTTVNVGSQVSGIIDELNVDFNSIVREGEVIMRLDPSLFETQVEQARANLVRAEADAERLLVSLDDAKVQLGRAQDLASRQLISAIELEAAQVTVRLAEAQLKSSEAAIIQAMASLNHDEVNLEHTVITAPIDGIVISRLVDVGQTVAASLQAPELFVIAADLTKMRVIANIDESDVGRIRPNQRVTFFVDAFPGEEFEGLVSQVRLEPVITQNVVTYATVVDAPNPDLRLKPGMTATITLETARRENVLRIPNTALRFRPTNEMFTALGQSLPQANLLEGPPTRNRSTPSNMSENKEPVETVGDGLPATERFGQITPEEREQFEIRRSARRDNNARFRGNGAPGSPRARRLASESNGANVPTVERGASTIDALFGALPVIATTGRVWILDDESLQQINVRLGVTDGASTELLGVLEGVMPAPESLQDGTILVTNITTPDESSSGANAGSPFIPRFGRRR